MLMMIRLSVPLCVLLTSAGIGRAAAPDYSKEPLVVQSLTTEAAFSAEGSRTWKQELAVKVQSEAAVRQFGVLAFTYSSDNEQLAFEYVRVRKADGSLVVTPAASIMDVATQVATEAPTYSDLRQKQVPVKSLGVGDVLEYSVRGTQSKPEVPGQFWYGQAFAQDVVVLNQSLEIRVPKDKYVQVSSPKLKSENRDEGSERIYVWKYSQLELSKPVNPKAPPAADEAIEVQITTFRNWEEVGNWWAALASPQAEVTPAIESKAKQLTAGLSTETDKAKAIYKYVAMKFRYISISLGAGKYKPHSAAEVLEDQYGDCKDKHTLLVSLLKAAGIAASPALIGAGLKFDASVPSPSQFNHVITVLPQNGTYVWLDSTSEVAPFGLINAQIRDQDALVIPSGGKPLLVKTPLNPPFPASVKIDVKTSLDHDGTLTGHFDFDYFGDDGVVMRAGFHQLAPTQWQQLTQQISYAFGFSGDVSGVEVERLDEIDSPFHYSYDYTRKNFSDWENHRISPPMPGLYFGPGEEADKPKEPFSTGSPGTSTYRASVQLPKGFSVTLPDNTAEKSAFAEYSAHYSLKDGTLLAERTMIVKQAKVSVDQWADYQKFQKAIRADQNQFVVLTESSRTQTSSVNSTGAQDLLQRATGLMQARDLNGARALLVQAEHLNSGQIGLWATYGWLEMMTGDHDLALADYRKEIKAHPENLPSRSLLAWTLWQLGSRDEAIQVARAGLALRPDDAAAALVPATMLMQAKRYKEVLPLLDKPLAATPSSYSLRGMRIEAWLRTGDKESALADAQKVAKETSSADTLNELAYMFADTDTALEFATALSEKAIKQTEEDAAKTKLSTLQSTDLARTNALGADWDTLGWAWFKRGNLPLADKYLSAAWELLQRVEAADHLGALYEKEHKRDEAIRMWRLAHAVDNKDEQASDQLRKSGATADGSVQVATGGKIQNVSPAEALGRLRTIPVAALPKQHGSAEFFLLISATGIEDAQFISGIDDLKNAATALEQTKNVFAFPDEAGEKLVQRAILSCSRYTTPSCNLTFVPEAAIKQQNSSAP